jgi:probable HAF family extracellular repeat protein
MISHLKKNVLTCAAGVAVTVALLPGRALATQGFWNVDISTNSNAGDAGVVPNGINAAGVVVGQAYNNDGSDYNAFTFTPTTASTGTFAKIANPSDGHEGAGIAINNAGTVVGGYVQPVSPYEGYGLGTDGSGLAHNLGSLNGTGRYITTIATGISNSGLIGGYSTASDGLYHGFQYTGTPGSGTLVDLGVATAGQSTVINGMSNSGAYTVGVDQGGSTTPEQATVYVGTPNTGGHYVELGQYYDAKDNINTTHLETTWGQAINNSGEVVGDDLRGYGYHATAYTGTLGSGTWTDLGILPDDSAPGYDTNYDSSQAFGINNLGDIVGTSAVAQGNDAHAFVYIGTPGAGGHMVDLQDWFVANYPSAVTAGWELEQANAINDSGMITGLAFYTGASENLQGGPTGGYSGFELDASALIASAVPEPTSLTLLGLTAMPLLARRRRTAAK